MGRLQTTDFNTIAAQWKTATGRKNLTHYPKVFVETGTWRGEQMEIAAPLFPLSYGIELDRHFFGVTKTLVAPFPKCKAIHGNSLVHLPKLMIAHTAPIFFALDAHYTKAMVPPIKKGEFPLFRELELIQIRNQADIVVVDDVHNFGVDRQDLKQDNAVKEWENVTIPFLHKFFGNRIVWAKEMGDGYVIILKKGVV